MATNVYNVIWADDDIDSFRRDDTTRKLMETANIHLLDYAHTSTELKLKLDKWEYMVDAVITDGNFDKQKVDDIVRSTSGLSHVLSFINEYNKKRFIPFFLYTGKRDLLREKFDSGELEYFEETGRIFEKSSFKSMLLKIREDVDKINSPQFQIRNKYNREFEAAKLIEGAEENLVQGLMYLYEESKWKNTQDYFNPARKIVERIVTSCTNMNILPPHISLNTACKIFEGKSADFSLTTPIMDKPLAESLRFFLSITQDGSHDACDLQLGVDQYVRKNKNVNLYLSILHIAMDLLLWHNQIWERFNNNEKRFWYSNFVHEGRVVMLPNGKFYTNKYLLDTKDIEIKEGDWVGILGSIPNRFPQGKITEFVQKSNYIILERTSRSEEL